MKPYLETLFDERLLLDPDTGAPLSALGHTSAGTNEPRYAIKNSVLDLYGAYENNMRLPPLADDFVRQVAKALSFPDRPEVLAAVRTAVDDSRLATGDAAFTAEIQELADRLGIPGHEVPDPVPPAVDNRAARIAFEGCFVEPSLPPHARLRRSVRIRNEGRAGIASAGRPPLLVAYHWLDEAGLPVVWDGARSALPVPVAPGASLTVICEIATPGPGRYRLQFQALLEGERWLEGARLTVPVTVEPAPMVTLALGDTGCNYDYGKDHAVGVGMMAQHLAGKPARGRRRILEVGSGIHPQAAALIAHGCDLVSLDISFPMSQLGSLYFEHVDPSKWGHIAFVTADAHDPPFPEGSFDGVAIFSALHHFADPVRLLANLRRMLAPGGFIAVMCEPCAPEPAAEMYLRDLRKGINEQCWTVEEHGEIFLRAGLRAVAGHRDVASLKVILEP